MMLLNIYQSHQILPLYFDGVTLPYDHFKHGGSHAFVSLTMSTPILHENAGKQ